MMDSALAASTVAARSWLYLEGPDPDSPDLAIALADEDYATLEPFCADIHDYAIDLVGPTARGEREAALAAQHLLDELSAQEPAALSASAIARLAAGRDLRVIRVH
jgi:hypothetical protein